MELGWENAPYNQFSLARSDIYDITFSTFLEPPLRVPDEIHLAAGDGTIRGYVRALRQVLRMRRFDLVHAHTPHVGAFFLTLRGLFSVRAVPTVYTVHNCFWNYKLRNRLLLILVFAGFDRVVCCGRTSLNSFPRFYRWLARGRLCCVQNGVDLARIDAAIGKLRQSGRKQFTVISVGRLIPIKEPFVLLRGFSRAAEGAFLQFVGEGPLRPCLERECDRQDLKSVEFVGRIPRDRVFEALASASVFISTSRGEGLPVAVLEAMACGCPVILSDIQPHREAAAGNPAVCLVKEGDVEGFARAITRFREMPLAERLRRGRECRRIVETHFNLDRMLRQYDSIYGSLLNVSVPFKEDKARGDIPHPA